MFDSLTTARLRAPFHQDEHEVHERFNLIYLREPAINDRLTRVLGQANWSFTLLGEPVIHGEGSDMPSVTQQARLSMRFERIDGSTVETHYDNVGGDVLLSLGKTLNEKLMNTVKAAATDAFKRCAASGGVGLYLKTIGDTKIDGLTRWMTDNLGYIPDLRAAKTALLAHIGYKKDDSEGSAVLLQELSQWRARHGFTDYDLMTIAPYIRNLWTQEHEL